ncbi:neurogenic locus notch homolog protein 1-like [Littorina saxatilis]|uniref:neurogenic locus notch homolog protein 1-like n=1 Tax=Littorina saxatilis TaxID=31220 RepID=UPI0038B5D01E
MGTVLRRLQDKRSNWRGLRSRKDSMENKTGMFLVLIFATAVTCVDDFDLTCPDPWKNGTVQTLVCIIPLNKLSSPVPCDLNVNIVVFRVIIGLSNKLSCLVTNINTACNNTNILADTCGCQSNDGTDITIVYKINAVRNVHENAGWDCQPQCLDAFGNIAIQARNTSACFQTRFAPPKITDCSKKKYIDGVDDVTVTCEPSTASATIEWVLSPTGGTESTLTTCTGGVTGCANSGKAKFTNDGTRSTLTYSKVTKAEGGTIKCKEESQADECTVEVISDACSSGPCQNGATCLFNATTESFECICPFGFAGDTCEIAPTSTTPGDTESRSSSTLVIGLGVAGCVCVVMAAVGYYCFRKRRPGGQNDAPPANAPQDNAAPDNGPQGADTAGASTGQTVPTTPGAELHESSVAGSEASETSEGIEDTASQVSEV